MSWGTTYKQDVDIYREQFTSKDELKTRIEEVKEDISYAKQRLLQLASCTPKDLIIKPEDWDSPLDFIHHEFKNIIDMYEEDILLLYKLDGLLENFDNKENF